MVRHAFALLIACLGLSLFHPAEARAAGPDSLHVQLWNTRIHSIPDVARIGQPFELLIHLIWGSRTGEETLLPMWRPQPGIDLLASGYDAKSSRDQPGGGYAVHAVVSYRLVARRQGVLPMDSIRVALVRGTARREVVFAHTAIKVLPPVSLWPSPWSWVAFGSGVVLLAAGILLARRSRPRKPARREPTPEERSAARLQTLRDMTPDKSSLAALIEYIRQEAVRRYGGEWNKPGEEAFRSWAAASRAPELVRERVGGLSAHLESRRFVPEDPEPAVWTHWLNETERLWRVEEELAAEAPPQAR